MGRTDSLRDSICALGREERVHSRGRCNAAEVTSERHLELRTSRTLDVTHKLSCGPKTFVGMAEVKLSPYWSLYALRERMSRGRSTYASSIAMSCLYVPVLDVYKPFCVRVAEVALMWEAEVDLGLV